MHISSFVKAEVFEREYARQLKSDAGGRLRVLEVGSKSYHEQDTFKAHFPASAYDYSGLDLEAGNNVDIVPANPFIWNEIDANSYDICVSGQTFEHNPYFWVTFAEIARVLKPGGLVFIVAPGGGAVHRYPVDCWRFYPDSWIALCTATGMELLESYFENDRMAAMVKGGHWRDSVVIAQKPVLSGVAQDAFDRRLSSLVKAFRDEIIPVNAAPSQVGKWAKAYEAEMKKHSSGSLWRRLRRIFAGRLAHIHK